MPTTNEVSVRLAGFNLLTSTVCAFEFSRFIVISVNVSTINFKLLIFIIFGSKVENKYLDFRISLYLKANENNAHEKTLTISTVIKFHSWLGRLYFFPVKPFHRPIVHTMLKGMIKHLEEKATT
ncbi:DUF2867 domain-containing protein [Pedobacter xixiisoli]|uniref:DUF2867 domain-containing protein n=1 Tax=Pedobacter xixiisoli TaxID=1476464 RepID=UPI000BE37C8F